VPATGLFTSPCLHRQKCFGKYPYVFLSKALSEVTDAIPKGTLICRGHRNKVSVTFSFEISWVVKEKNKLTF